MAVVKDAPKEVKTETSSDSGTPTWILEQQYEDSRAKTKFEEAQEVYRALAAPFDETFKDNRGGVELEYITGEQVVSRLNNVLGFNGWDFEVKEHGINNEAEEVWVLGSLTVRIPGTYSAINREQFGSQKIRRSKATNKPVEIGFDFKGAGTDALKKCAQALGVGLYLAKRDPNEVRPQPQQYNFNSGPQPSFPTEKEGPFNCEVEGCGEEIEGWPTIGKTAADVAGIGRSKFGKSLCQDHYKQAKAGQKV